MRHGGHDEVHTRNGVATDTETRMWELSRTEDVLRTVTVLFSGDDPSTRDVVGRAREAARAVQALLTWMDEPDNRPAVDDARFDPRYAERVADLEVPVRVLCGHLNAVARAVEPARLHEGLRAATATVVVQLEQVVELLRTGVAPAVPDERAQSYLTDLGQDLAGLRIDNETSDEGDAANRDDGAAALGDDLASLATRDLKTAERFQTSSIVIQALIVMLAAAILFGSPLATGSLHGDLTRLAVGVPLAALAGYLGRRSTRHRDRAERAHDLALHLRHLRSYTSPLGDEDKHRYRVELGQRGWPPQDPPQADAEPMAGVAEELARLTEVLRAQVGNGDAQKGEAQER